MVEQLGGVVGPMMLPPCWSKHENSCFWGFPRTSIGEGSGPGSVAMGKESDSWGLVPQDGLRGGVFFAWSQKPVSKPCLVTHYQVLQELSLHPTLDSP